MNGLEDLWVYRHLAADGSVLYVGTTTDPQKRQQNHKQRSSWFADIADVRYDGPMPRREALVREAELIGKLCPPYNRRFNPEAEPQPDRQALMPTVFQEFRANHSGHGYGECEPNCWAVAMTAVATRGAAA
jgi:hypothetical protein